MEEEFRRKSWKELGEDIIRIINDEITTLKDIVESDLPKEVKMDEFEEIAGSLLHTMRHVATQPKYKIPKECLREFEQEYSEILKEYHSSNQ